MGGKPGLGSELDPESDEVKTDPVQKDGYHGNPVCEPQFLCSLPPVEPYMWLHFIIHSFIPYYAGGSLHSLGGAWGRRGSPLFIVTKIRERTFNSK